MDFEKRSTLVLLSIEDLRLLSQVLSERPATDTQARDLAERVNDRLMREEALFLQSSRYLNKETS